MYFKWHGMDITFTETLEYAALEADFNNGIYYCFEATQYPAGSIVYKPGWQSLFWGYYHKQYTRIIDQKEEGIQPPHFKLPEEFKIDDSNAPGNNWYLVYQSLSADEDSGIQVQLWPEQPLKVKLANSNTFKVSDFATGTYYYIMPKEGLKGNHWHNTYNFENGNNPPQGRTLDLNIDLNNSGQGTLRAGWCHNKDYEEWESYVDDQWGQTHVVVHKQQYCEWMIIYRSGTGNNYLTIETWRSNDPQGPLKNTKVNTFTTNAADVDTLSFSGWAGTGVKYYTASAYKSNIYELYQYEKNGTWGSSGAWNFTTTTETLSSFSAIDRTDTKLVKIIKAPYSIVNIDSDGILNTNDWGYTSGHLVLINKNAKFINTIESEYNPLEVFIFDQDDAPGADVNRNDNHESKIYSSEFYMPKFVYDSFSYQYMLENIDSIAANDPNIIEYQATTTINSRFLFKFNLPLKRSTSDYDNICVVARNNEVPIYSNAYLNYIRTGYNYDVKNKNANLTKGAVGVAGAAASGALAAGLAITKIGAAAGSSVGPVGTAVGAAAGAVIGLATGLITLAISQSQADNAIKQKLDEASRQATSVNGGDDIDLLDNYTNGNKAKYVIYRCSDKVRQTMLDLFYYCGYSDDVYGVPNLNTRKYFNYIECEPVFNEENNTVYGEFLNDIKERYKAGITVYHDVNSLSSAAEYDWDQVKENWETSLL